MKNEYHTLLLDKPFDTVLSEARTALTDNGWLLLHEINPQQILAGHGYIFPKARQLFFFHPQYLYTLWQQDAGAVMEAPLKLLLQEITPEQTAVRYLDIDTHFNGYTPEITPIVEAIKKQLAPVIARLQ